MLERMWRKGNLLTLLVGMQTGTATMEKRAQEALSQQALGQAAAPPLGQELRQILEVEDEHDDRPVLVLHGHHIHQAAEAGGCKHRGKGGWDVTGGVLSCRNLAWGS